MIMHMKIKILHWRNQANSYQIYKKHENNM